MRKLPYLLCFIMLCCGSLLLAQSNDRDAQYDPPKVATAPDEEESPTSYNYKINMYEQRFYSKSRMEELKQSKDFQYDEETVTKDIERSNSNANKTRSEPNADQTDRSSSSSHSYTPPKGGGTGSLVMLLVIFVVIVIILLFALGLKPSTWFRRSTKDVADNTTTEDNTEDIHSMAFESALDKAIRLKNYKLAVRILYLETLKKLSDKQLIDWKINKTNWDYVRELGNSNLKPGFRQITNSFDYVWYGNFNIDASTFALMQEKINLFKQSI
jgi:Domain of unknown function (DUF4129)